MTYKNSTLTGSLPIPAARPTFRERINRFPWWFAALIVIAVATFITISTQENFREPGHPVY